jgi:HEXXH motif-containing protein
MVLEDPACRGFACPHVGLDKQFLEMIVTGLAQQVVEKLLQRHGDRLDRNASGLGFVLGDWLRDDPTFDTAWHLAFGNVWLTLFVDDGDNVERSAGALGLRLHEGGLEGEWTVRLRNPARFRFDRWLLPASDTIHVSAAAGVVTVRTRTANVWNVSTFHHAPNGWEATAAQMLPVLARPGVRWKILEPRFLPPGSVALRWLAQDGFDFERAEIDIQPDLVVRNCDAALTLLSDYADVYLPWVCTVIRDLVPLPPRSSTLSSLSDEFTPGVITFTDRDNRCALAEMFVHEASHQYFHILKTLGPVDDGTDQHLYYSPVRGTGRPIYYILVAYHAFANVLIFYREALAHGLSPDQPGVCIEQQIDDLSKQLEVLDQALQTTRALTPIGRALYGPLAERLRH